MRAQRTNASRRRPDGVLGGVLGVLGLLAAVGLAGCSPDPGPGTPGTGAGTQFSPSSSATTGPTQTPTAGPSTVLGTHQTPDAVCPTAWSGLQVTVDEPDELAYLQSIPVCTSGGTRVWLRNNSDVVWAISYPTVALSHRTSATTSADSFRSIVAGDKDGYAVFAPKDQIVIDAPPDSVSLRVTTSLNVAWESHTIAVEELTAWGQAYAVEALRLEGRTTMRSAVAQCTLSGYELGSSAFSMEQPVDKSDVQALMTQVVGIGVAGNKCWRATRAVQQPVGVADDLATGMTRFLEQPSVIEGVHTRMVWVQRARAFSKLL